MEQNSEKFTAVGHPWRRYFARMTDLGLYGTLWAAIQYLLLRWWPPENFLVNTLIGFVVLGIMLIVEPVLLCTWGTTPGKWIMGLRILNENGEKLTYREACRRTFLVLGKGMGYGIPIYNLVRMYKCSRKTLDNEQLDWEENESYYLLDFKEYRGWCIALAYLACIALAAVIVLAGLLPRYRGELTPVQYAANCNELFRRNSSRSGAYYEMDAAGNVAQKVDANAIPIFPDNPPLHALSVENGAVKGVRLEMSGDYASVYFQNIQITVAYLAFVGAQKGTDAISLAKFADSYGGVEPGVVEGNEYGVRVRRECTALSEDTIRIVFTMQKE